MAILSRKTWLIATIFHFHINYLPWSDPITLTLFLQKIVAALDRTRCWNVSNTRLSYGSDSKVQQFGLDYR